MSLFILIPSVIDRNVHMKTCLERMKQSNSPNIAFKHQFHLYLQQLCNVGCTKYNTNALGMGNTLKKDKLNLIKQRLFLTQTKPQSEFYLNTFCLTIRPGLQTWILYRLLEIAQYSADVQVYTICRRSVKINVDR